MIKRICGLLIILLLFQVGVLAEDAVPVGENTKLSLSLADCIDMAYEESPELKIWDINKQSFEKQLKDAILSQREMRNTPIYMSSNFELVYVKNGYYVTMFRKYLDLSADEEGKIKSTLAYGMTQKYYTYQNAVKVCETAYSAVERAKVNLRIIKEKFDLGMCTGLDVTNAEIALSEAQNYFVQMQHNAELAKDTLSIALGIDEDMELILTDTIQAPTFEANLEEDIQKAMESRYDVKALRTNAELAQLYYEPTKSLDDDSTTYFSAYSKYIESTYNYDTGVKNIALAIKSSYFDAINAHNSAETAKRKLEYKKNEYEVHKIRFEMGMITNLMLTALSDEITAAEISYENALLTEKLAVEKYAYQINKGL